MALHTIRSLCRLLPFGLIVAEICGVQGALAAYTNTKSPQLSPRLNSRAEASPQNDHPLSAEQFYKFKNGSVPENIGVRKNGKLLVTLNTSPDLYQINPYGEQDGELLHSFKGYNALFGITEVEHDVFYLLSGNWSNAPDYQGVKGSWSVWSVDMGSHPKSYGNRGSKQTPRVRKVTDIPEATLLDGFTALNYQKGLAVTGDATTGTLYVIDTKAGKSREIYQDDKLAGKSKGGKGTDAFGINGMKYRNGRLYFTNASKALLATLAIDANTGDVTKGAKAVTEGEYDTFIDEFAFDPKGNIYMAADLVGIYYLPVASRQSYEHLIDLPGISSVTLGRTDVDATTLYVTTGVKPPQGVSRIECGARVQPQV